jgi:peptidoglycan/LPS O-acetylase OafA/YrhL
MIVCGFAWKRRQTPEGAFAFGVCGSAAVYVLTFFAVGVASDFRYGYWAVLAGIAGGPLAMLGRRNPRISVNSSGDYRKAP